MNSIKVRDGKVKINGVVYSTTPTETVIMGKAGRIHSINIGGVQYFPISGVFDDGTIPQPSEVSEPIVKKKAKATKMVEDNGEPLDEKGHLIGKKKRAKKAK